MFTSLKISPISKNTIPWLLALGFALLYFSTLISPQKLKPSPQSEPQSLPQTEETATESGREDDADRRVTRVIDGDTIEIKGGTRVRYIGVDTPEPGECFGKEATEANSRLVANKKLKLETDIQTHDRYGRLLAYVWIGELMVNEELVRQGAATVTTYAPNVKYTDIFLGAQQEARDGRRGLWSDNPCPTPPDTATSGNTPVQGAKEGCVIKGNISSSGEKIYHIPGQRYYERTKIDEGGGERWFCSENEAVNSGWRKSKI